MSENLNTVEYQAGLILELCDLLRQVLGQQSGQGLEETLKELLSEFSSIRVMMERQTLAVETALPKINVIEELIHAQNSLAQNFQSTRTDINWIRNQMERPSHGE